MKKLILGVLAIVLVLGAGSAFANSDGDGEGTFNFGQMLPFMKQMHPGWSDEELKEMYNACHGTNGAAPSKNFQYMNQMRMTDL